MSFAALLNRTIVVTPRDQVTADAYGNRVLAAGSGVSVRARRQQVDRDELVGRRDQQAERWLYFVPAGTAIDGRSLIVDDGTTFEVDGPPDLMDGRHGAHHVEFVVKRFEG